MNSPAEYIGAFGRVFKCHVCFHDYEGLIRKIHGGVMLQHFNPFCDRVKKSREFCEACTEFDAYEVRSRLACARAPFFKICHMGVMEAVVPLFAGTRLAAAMFAGPFLPGKYGRSFRGDLLQHRVFTKAAPSTAKLKAGLRTMGEDSCRDIMGFAELLAANIEAAFFGGGAGEEAGGYAERIRRFIDREFRHGLYVSDVARLLGLTESRIVQIFREQFKKSFVDVLTERRMEHARHLLKESFLKIGTVAAECGYGDTAYFHRVFKSSNRGMTPAAYRKKVQSSSMPLTGAGP